MGHYLINFAAYTLAMVGFICLCLVVYKKTFVDQKAVSSTKFLVVENKLNLSPRKSIYVIKAGEEKFLVASDVDQTTFLAKLGEKTNIQPSAIVESSNVTRMPRRSALAGVSVDKDVFHTDSNVRKMPVMKELARKLSAQNI